MEVVEITGREAFGLWLRSRKDVPRFRFGRLTEPEKLTLTTGPDLGDDPAGAGRLAPVVLPDPDQATRWWDELWNGEIIDYWIFRDWGELTTVVAAKAGVWRPQNTLHARLGPQDFTMICDDEFAELVGIKLASRMVGEARLVGFSVRLVPAEPESWSEPEEQKIRPATTPPRRRKSSPQQASDWKPKKGRKRNGRATE